MQLSKMKTPPIHSAVLDALSSLWTQLRASALIPVCDTECNAQELDGESDFEGWLRGSPRVTMNPANAYGASSRGYFTNNGLRSLEIGAADD